MRETTYPLSPLQRHVLIAVLAMTALLGRAVHADTVFAVDTVVDDVTAVNCLDDIPADCSLRGAITAANSIPLPEVVTINLPIGDYDLVLNGAGEDGNQSGDLDVLRSLAIQGSGSFAFQTRVRGGGSGGRVTTVAASS